MKIKFFNTNLRIFTNNISDISVIEHTDILLIYKIYI